MQEYPPPPQKSSDLLPVDYIINYGFPISVAVEAVKQGKAAHMRIYEAALRYGLEGLLMSAADLIHQMSIMDIKLSPAQAQRILTDDMLFVFVDEYRSGSRGRPTKRYRMKPSIEVAQALGFDWHAEHAAPKLRPVDLSSCRRYKLAIFGRATVVRGEESRQTQVRNWSLSRQTLIRWTREACKVVHQIDRHRNDHPRFSWFGDENDADLFLRAVYDTAKEKPHKYWLEVVNHAGEIRKLPCSPEVARRWLAKGTVTLCQQKPNVYLPRAGYYDALYAEMWF